jgi:GTP-binding protein HflX
VNLARLEYLLPRLRRMWTHLERQKGGIGLRGGPGEQQIEVDRRRIRQQIDRLQRELEGVRRHRAELRRSRHRHGWAAASLVGYTNAGKSTLLNRLTGADVVTNDQLFVTLDPTTRQIRLPNRQRVLLTDTVGFIRKLPHHLVESFKATLEEVILADILVHVVDASHPRVEQQIDAVQTVLKEMGVHDKSVLTVFNKIDCEGAEARAKKLARNVKPSVLLSARGGYGLEYFAESMADILRERNTGLCLRIPQARARMLSELRAEAMIREEAYAGQDVLMDVRLPEWMAGRYEPYAIQRDDYVKTLNATDGHQWEQQEKSEGKNLYHT